MRTKIDTYTYKHQLRGGSYKLTSFTDISAYCILNWTKRKILPPDWILEVTCVTISQRCIPQLKSPDGIRTWYLYTRRIITITVHTRLF